MTRLTFGRPVRPWKNQNVVKSGCILYYFRKTFLWFLIIFGFFPILKKLVRISIVMGTRFSCIRNVTCNKTEILDFINQMPPRNISLKIYHKNFFMGVSHLNKVDKSKMYLDGIGWQFSPASELLVGFEPKFIWVDFVSK